MKRRMIAALMLLCMLFSSAPAQASGTATLSVSEVMVTPGEVAEVSVHISGNPGLAAWMFELSWDTSALSLDTTSEIVEVGTPFSSGTMLARETDGGVTVAWINIDDIDSDGILFQFRVKATGAAGTYPITVTCSENNTINVREEPISISSVTSNITISETGDTSSGNEDTPDHDNPPTEDAPQQPIPENTPFQDVAENAFYHDAVLWAVSRNITTGTSLTTFSPNATCTRAQTVTFLWRAAGSPEPVVMDNPFSDVVPGSYYYKAVLWAAENGITGGTSSTTFSPDATVTRAQVVTFLWRAAGSNKAEGQNPFRDVPQDQYYSNAVQWAVMNGITGGTSATTFSPLNGCTRGQIVTFLFRTYANEEASQ